MDTFLTTTNHHPNQFQSPLFVDDVLRLAKSLLALKRFLRDAVSCSHDYDMIWAISKSCELGLPIPVQLHNERMPDKSKACYLGIWIRMRGVLDDQYLTRIQSALKFFCLLKKTTTKWNLSSQQRRRFVKTFVFGITASALFLQPFTERTTSLAKSLDQLCLNYIAGPQSTPNMLRAVDKP